MSSPDLRADWRFRLGGWTSGSICGCEVANTLLKSQRVAFSSVYDQLKLIALGAKFAGKSELYLVGLMLYQSALE